MARREVESWLEGQRRLRVHAVKTRVFPVRDGVPFVGFRVFPRYVRIDPRTGRRFVRRLRDLGRAYSRGEIELDRINRSVVGWVGHARHGTTRRLVSRVLWQAVVPPRTACSLQRGESGQTGRVVRGGSWNNNDNNLRCANRNNNNPDNSNNNIGFRVARTLAA